MSTIVEIHTDGACINNPGPAGAGVVLRYGVHMKQVKLGLGIATNNIAELMAIKTGLEQITDRSKPIIVYSDSKYSIGILTEDWKAKKNKELVEEIRTLIATFSNIRFEWVKAHDGDTWNEKADELANAAATLPEGKIEQERFTKSPKVLKRDGKTKEDKTPPPPEACFEDQPQC